MEMHSGRRALNFIVPVMLIGIIYRILLAWSGWAEGYLVADDAYYYFKIASNIASGLGPTFDGMTQTNGFHPLWMIMLLPVFALFGKSLWLPVRVALSISIILDTISGLLIYKILKDENLEREGIVAAAIWFLSPFTLLTGLRGMEGSASTTVILLLTWFLVRVSNNKKRLDCRSALATGALIGMAGLARTDNLLIVGLTVTIFMAFVFRKQCRSFLSFVRWLATTASAALLVTLPWFIWNYLNFGGVLQVSGAVKISNEKVFGSIPIQWNSLKGLVKTLIYPFFLPIIYPSRFASGQEFSRTGVWPLVVLGVLAAIVVPIVVARKEIARKLEKPSIRHLLIIAVAFMATHTLVLGYIFRLYVTWYPLPYLAFLSVICGISIPAFWALTGGKGAQKTAFVLLTATLVFGIHPLFIRQLREFQRPDIALARPLKAVAAQYPEGVNLGSYNAGALGYVAPAFGKIRVINLDGLVNNSVYESARRGKYLDYLLEHVDVFFDNPKMASIYLKSNEVDSLCSIYRKWDGYDLWSKQ